MHEARLQPIALPAMQSLILGGGENLLMADCANWLARYPEHHLYNEYGPTEATVAVTQFELTSRTLSNLMSVPIGKPGSNIVCRLQNGAAQVTAPDTIGELYVGGECLARGYLQPAGINRRSFRCAGWSALV